MIAVLLAPAALVFLVVIALAHQTRRE